MTSKKNTDRIRRHLALSGRLGQVAVALLVLAFASPSFAQVSFNGGGTGGGAIRVGTSTTTCNSSMSGGLRYDATTKCIELCDGTSWACISVGACTDASPNAFDFTDLVN